MENFHLLLLSLLACLKAPSPGVPVIERASLQAELRQFHDEHLLPSPLPKPHLNGPRSTQLVKGIAITLTPLFPEDLQWNQRGAGDLMLFNNRSVLLYSVNVEITGEHLVQWLPQDSGVEINSPNNTYAVGETADRLLLPLMHSALNQERHVLEGDLVKHSRGAGPFRGAYLSTDRQTRSYAGLIGFPIWDEAAAVSAARVQLKFTVNGVLVNATCSWD